MARPGWLRRLWLALRRPPRPSALVVLVLLNAIVLAIVAYRQGEIERTVAREVSSVHWGIEELGRDLGGRLVGIEAVADRLNAEAEKAAAAASREHIRDVRAACEQVKRGEEHGRPVQDYVVQMLAAYGRKVGTCKD